MSLTSECKKSYLDILQEIFNEREYVKINIMTKKTPKLAVKENIPIHEERIIEDLKLRLLKGVKMSVAYIVRKYKMTPERARELIVSVSVHECCEWDGMIINYFDPEFECCCGCFREEP